MVDIEDVFIGDYIEGNKIYLSDGSISFCYAFTPWAFESRHGSSIKRIMETIKKAFTYLPYYTTVSKYDFNLKVQYDCPYSINNSYFKKAYKKYYNGLDFVITHCYWVINFSHPFVCNNVLHTPFNPNNKIKEKPVIEEKILESLNDFLDALGVEKINLRALNTFEVESLLYRFANQETTLDSKNITGFSNDYHNEYRDSFLKVGTNKIQVLNLEANKVSSTSKNCFNDGRKGNLEYFFTSCLLTHKKEGIVVTHIRKEDKREVLANVKKARWLYNTFSPPDNIKWLRFLKDRNEEVTNYLKSIKDEESFLTVSVNIFLKDKNMAFLKAHIKKTIDVELKEQNYDSLAQLVNSFPGQGKYVFWGNYYPLTEGVNFINLYGNDLFKDEGCFVYQDRVGNPCNLDLNSGTTNNNTVVVGPSGSGKSFFVADMICASLNRGEKVMIIDVGGSFKFLVEAMKGKYIDGSEEYPVRFNPMKFATGSFTKDSNLLDTKVSFLCIMIEIIWGKKLKSEAKTILSELFKQYYRIADEEGKKDVSLIDFYSYVNDPKRGKIIIDEYYFDLKGFGIVLKPFVIGERRELLNSPDPTPIEDYPAIAFDLKHMKRNTELYPLFAFLVTDICYTTMFKPSKKMKRLHFDEGWEMLKIMDNLLMEVYSSIRKENGSVNLIVQDAITIKNSKYGGEILTNAAKKIILWHPTADLQDKVKNVLELPNEEYKKLQSLRRGKHFRELLVLGSDNLEEGSGEVLRIQVMDEYNGLFTTDKDERPFVEKCYRELGNIEPAIEEFKARRKTGIWV